MTELVGDGGLVLPLAARPGRRTGVSLGHGSVDGGAEGSSGSGGSEAARGDLGDGLTKHGCCCLVRSGADV